MAAVDLYGTDAGRIRTQYQTSLQRPAEDTEVEGWMTGRFGGGGVDDWLTQIAQSGEAQERGTYKPPAQTVPTVPSVLGQQPNVSRPQTPQKQAPSAIAGTPVPWTHEGWADANRRIQDAYGAYGRTATDEEAYKWLQGQFGYGNAGDVDTMVKAIHGILGASTTTPPGTTPPTTTGTQTPPNNDYRGWFQSLTAGKAPNPRTLESLGSELAKYGVKLGSRNASGFIDQIILPDGSAWDVIQSATPDGGVAWQWIPAGGGTGPRGVGGGDLPTNQYSDPYTQMLENLIKSRIGMLQSPVDDFYRQQYQTAMQNRANALGQAEPQYAQLLKFLQDRFESLKGPGYTGAENEVIRTGALDPIERDRTAAKKRMADQLASRGLDPNSGIFQDAMRQVDATFDGMRGVTQNELTINDLNRRESRQQRAETLGAQLVDIPQMRSREQLDVFGALEQLSNLVRQDEEGRSREAIGYAGGLNDLSMNRLQMAMQAAGLGGNPMSLLSGLTNIAGLNQNAAMLNRSSSANLWSGLGSIAAMLASGRR